MSRFSQIAKGTRQIDECELALPGVEQPVKVGLRPLASEDDDSILKEARAFAIAQGVPDPKDGNPIYDLALARHTLTLACVDVDSDGKREPFFANEAEVRTLDRDRIAYLYSRQQAWQDKCAPLPKSMSEGEFLAKVLEIAGAGDDDERPFDSLRPALLVSFTRTICRQFVNLAMLKSPSGSDSTAASSASTSPKLDS